MEISTTRNQFGAGEVRSWASLIDESCMAQAEAISRVPIVDGYVALMPDAHFGFGPPVGSAIRTHAGVMPYAVGVDIGCGMIAVRTNLHRDAVRGREGPIMGNIRRLIPADVGKGHSEELPQSAAFFAAHGLPPGITALRGAAEDTARRQFGTLGSGNHFVEVCTDPEDVVWLLLHSGSRGIGNQLATMHVKRAQSLAAEKAIALENSEFAWFERNTADYEQYITDMLWAQAYAFAQREAMMDNLIVAVSTSGGTDGPPLHVEERINCHHNYAEFQPDGALLTRKGAIDATAGKPGIIPGSMGASTYIVRGLGNEEAYCTSPHGAGRILGRNAARKSLDLESFRAQMAGRTWQDRDAKALLDESPSAYKPIETVIEDSRTLVEPATVLSQFINYKGL